VITLPANMRCPCGASLGSVYRDAADCLCASVRLANVELVIHPRGRALRGRCRACGRLLEIDAPVEALGAMLDSACAMGVYSHQ
jgi:hypothetical protein